MERGGRPLVQALDVVPAEVSEPKAAPRERYADLTRMQVARKDEMKRPRLELVYDAGEVAEQDAQISCRIRQPVRVRGATHVRTRIDAGDLNAPPTKVDRPGIVRQQRRAPEVLDPTGLRKRVAGRGEVVVSEYRVTTWHPFEQASEPPLTARSRDEIAADQRQVGLAGFNPLDRTRDGARAA